MSQEESTSVRESGELKTPLVVGVGLFLGVSAFALSVTGILWRISVVSVGACLVAALLVLALWIRRLGARCEMRIRALLLLLPLVILPAIAALAPPYDWDEVAYGAALPRDYAAAGRFFYNADYGPYSAFPSNYEALTTAAIVLAGNVTPAHLLGVLLALGLAAIAVHLSRCLGASWPVAFCSAVLVLGAKDLASTIPMGKNDIANAFFQALSLLCVAGYAARRELRWLALGGFFLGIALGVKYSSLQFALCAVPLTAALVLTGSLRFSHRLRHLAVFGAVALAAALPWYARNYFAFDNPFYPFMNELLGAHNEFTREHSAITDEVFNGLHGYSWRTGSVRGFVSNLSQGFGRIPALLAVVGVVVAVWRKRDAMAVFLGVAFVSFGLVTLFSGYWLPRYVLCLLVLSSAFATVALAEGFLMVGRVAGRRAVIVALALFLLAVAGSSLRSQWKNERRFARDVMQLERQDFIRRHVRYWAVADWANRNLDPGDKIGLGVNIQPFYYLERPYFHIHPMTEKGNLQSLKTPDEFLQAFHALGLKWLAFSPYFDASLYPSASAPRMNAFLRRFYTARRALTRSGQLTLVADVAGTRIYRIEPARPADAAP